MQRKSQSQRIRGPTSENGSMALCRRRLDLEFAVLGQIPDSWGGDRRIQKACEVESIRGERLSDLPSPTALNGASVVESELFKRSVRTCSFGVSCWLGGGARLDCR